MSIFWRNWLYYDEATLYIPNDLPITKTLIIEGVVIRYCLWVFHNDQLSLVLLWIRNSPHINYSCKETSPLGLTILLSPSPQGNLLSHWTLLTMAITIYLGNI